MDDVLSGPVDVCIDLPRLALDRPFTYLLRADDGAGTGSFVSVPFHGRTAAGWVLGPAAVVPDARLLPVRRVRSRVRFFDEAGLRLLRWVSERYIAPLATVIGRSYPPRVAGLERTVFDSVAPAAPAAMPGFTDVLARYGGPRALARGTTTWLRPLPGEEDVACVAAVESALASARTALVIVPEASPLPRTAVAVLEAFGDRAARFVGGDVRERYRTWLEIRAGRSDVVVTTRPGVFAPIRRVGVIWVSREVHPAHRDDRSPRYHVRDVAATRARIEGAACVLASFCPSADTAAGIRAGTIRTARPARSVERAAAPLVETAAPGPEDRSPRLASLLRGTGGAALVLSLRGYGVARVCRRCGEPAACAVCRGAIVVRDQRAECAACGSAGVCATCGGRTFGVEPGGTERVAEWASRVASVPVVLERETDEHAVTPARGRVVVGTAAAVDDLGAVGLDLVAILDPDRALARPGLHAAEQAVATWMEAAAWTAGAPARGGGMPAARVLLQTRRAAHPAIQSVVRWDPEPFLRAELARRTDGGFAPGYPTFRIVGGDALEPALRTFGPDTILATPVGDRTVCLIAVRPDRVGALRSLVLDLVERGTVERVDAEPDL